MAVSVPCSENGDGKPFRSALTGTPRGYRRTRSAWVPGTEQQRTTKIDGQSEKHACTRPHGDAPVVLNAPNRSQGLRRREAPGYRIYRTLSRYPLNKLTILSPTRTRTAQRKKKVARRTSNASRDSFECSARTQGLDGGQTAPYAEGGMWSRRGAIGGGRRARLRTLHRGTA
jgi:hypothetical protein